MNKTKQSITQQKREQNTAQQKKKHQNITKQNKAKPKTTKINTYIKTQHWNTNWTQRTTLKQFLYFITLIVYRSIFCILLNWSTTNLPSVYPTFEFYVISDSIQRLFYKDFLEKRRGVWNEEVSGATWNTPGSLSRTGADKERSGQ